MPYIAQKRMKTGHDDETDTPIFRNHGDEIPEAESWSWQTRVRMENAGLIRLVPDAPRTKGTKNA